MELNPANIAVVDDDTQFVNVTVQLLAHNFDSNILSFKSGVSAWKHLEKRGSADIIISDVNMPGMNGFELLSKIKSKYPLKKCIMMSGDPSNETFSKQLGADAFLSKPFTMNDLLSTIQPLVQNESKNESGEKKRD